MTLDRIVAAVPNLFRFADHFAVTSRGGAEKAGRLE